FGELRELLTEAVSANQTVGERISADIDSVIGGFTAHAAGPVAPDRVLTGPAVQADQDQNQERPPARPPWEIDDDEREAMLSKPPWEDATPDGVRDERIDPAAFVPDAPASGLSDSFARAAGLAAVAEAQAWAREAQAARFVRWPLGALVRRRRDPVPALRGASASLAVAGVGQAQHSGVDNAITAFADAVGGQLPGPWSALVRDAARSNVTEVPAALAAAVHRAVPERARVPVWWRLITGWQWLLTVLAAVGVVWAVVIAVAHGGKQQSTLLSDTSLIPWLIVMAVALLVLGALTASGCLNLVLLAADREREHAERAMREQIAAVAAELVLAPVGREIAEYERFRRELAVAQGSHAGLPAA
ncbi:MAG TPA: hypothetical protein VF482_21610, partial [Trebonia sp.]